ncbi:unnamed protein product [Echinostoma caproni]|uniref:Secreted protein n=1 Tax=Echinostoma caproni TaxID=27848 RepID=A0A183AR60_9TREM|nr:unnamed protein product [Echinostoma caproni]
MLLGSLGLLTIALVAAASLYPMLFTGATVFGVTDPLINQEEITDAHEVFVSDLPASRILSQPVRFSIQCLVLITYTNQSVTHSLTSTRLALARLLLSVVPRYVIASLFNRLPGKSTTSDLYGEQYVNVGVALIQLTGICPPATRDRKTATDRTNSGTKHSVVADEPAQIADRLRLVNHVIGLLDALVDEQIVHTQGSDTTNKEATDSFAKSTCFGDPRLVKVFVGGTMLGYAVGLLPAKTIRDQSTRSKQMLTLLSFAERVLEICEEANAKTRMANGLVHARIGECNSFCATRFVVSSVNRKPQIGRMIVVLQKRAVVIPIDTLSFRQPHKSFSRAETSQ